MASLQQLAARAARRNRIPVPLFLELIKVESGWRPQIVSSAGAVGLTQLMPGTARGLGVDPMNPAQNLEGGARYLKAMYERFGSWPLALAAYNAGAGSVEQHNGIPPFPETQHYVRMIMGALKGGLKGTGPSMSSTSTLEVQSPEAQMPDLASVGLQNLSEHATPFESLQNLTAAIRAGGVGMPQSVGGRGQAMPMIKGGGASAIARVASRYIGVPYLWGGSSPRGFDCSGLLQYAAAKAGIHLPRTTYLQWGVGRPVAFNQLRPGDAVFFRGSDSKGGLPGHVGIYIGGGKMIDAPHTGARVRVESIRNFGGYMGARRY